MIQKLGLAVARHEFSGLRIAAGKFGEDQDGVFGSLYEEWAFEEFSTQRIFQAAGQSENGILGRRVEFLTGDGSRLTGLFRDIAPDGSVIFDDDGGRVLTLNCGDVRLLTRA